MYLLLTPSSSSGRLDLSASGNESPPGSPGAHASSGSSGNSCDSTSLSGSGMTLVYEDGPGGLQRRHRVSRVELVSTRV